jgi:hypothetical protein
MTTDNNARVAAYRTIAVGINRGLPAPKAVRFSDTTLTVELDNARDLDSWTEHFEFPAAGVYAGRNWQPYPDLVDPANSDQWITSAWRPWNGWHLYLEAVDPITDEQRQQWIDSGRAAQHRAHREGAQPK